MKNFFKSSSIMVIIIFFSLISLTSIAHAALTFSNTGITGDSSFNTLTIPGITNAGCLSINSSGIVSSTGSTCGSSFTFSLPLLNTSGTISINQAGTSSNGYLSSTDWNTFNGKQATLVSGTNIKTINSNTLLGPGDISVGTLLGFTPENIANKATDFSTVNNTLYPTVQAVKNYADSKILGLLNYRGGYDASVSTFPATGGSGSAGAVMKGDTWVISVNGTLGGTAIQAGDSIISNTDSPGQTAGNWNTINTNISYVPENQANKVTSISSGSTDTQYPSAKLLYNSLANTLTGLSINSSNGFAGTSSGSTTPALTITTSITGLLKGNGTAISAATVGTDYSLGTSALSTGILKSTTGTGALTIATSGDFPTLNQDTTGKSAKTDALNSASTVVNISSALAPTNGQVLTATSGTTATWQTPSVVATPAPQVTYVPAGVSDGGTAFAAGLTRYDNNEPQAGSVNPASSSLGYLAFNASPLLPQYAEQTIALPPYWTGTSIYINFYSAATTGSVAWEVQSACTPLNGVVGSASFGTPVTVTTVVSSVSGGLVATASTTLAANGANGCPVANATSPTLMTYRIFRASSDSASGNANLLGVTLVTGRSQ
jgi:hypothetical protein